MENRLLTLESKNSGTCHEYMKADVSEKYFEQMLEFISEGTVIVMDKAKQNSFLQLRV